MDRAARHDILTVIAVAACAFVVADLSHEALGHGTVAWLTGAKQIVLSYTYLSTDIQSRWISLAGPAANLIEGVAALACLGAVRRGAARLFVFLLMAFNLLNAAAYLVYSGVLNSGDLAVAVAGLPHLDLIRIAMVIAGLAAYVLFIVVGAKPLRSFLPPRGALALWPYLAAFALNAAAACLNPLGIKYFLISALPATLGSNAGLFAMARLADGKAGQDDDTAQAVVPRSLLWIAAGLVLAAGYIFVIGPGVECAGLLSRILPGLAPMPPK